LSDWADGPDPTLDELLARAADMQRPFAVSGGEPTLRPDLPALIAGLAATSQPWRLVTDALPMRSAAAVATLHQAGLRAVRIRLHAPRADAHDWLAGQPGSFATALKAARNLRAAGLRLELACTVSRPAAPLLPDLVDVAVSLGGASLHLDAPRRAGPLTESWVALSPRWARLQPLLELAAARATRARLPLTLRGWPTCVAPADCTAPTPPARLAARCAGCPGPESCPGPDADYTDLFGRAELASQDRRAGPRRVPKAPGAPAPPPPRSGRSPSTRVRDVLRQVARGDLGGDPLVGAATAPLPDPMVWRLDDRPSRVLRQELVAAAQQGPRRLLITGPGLRTRTDLGDLLKEPARLTCFDDVEVLGALDALDSLDERSLRRLRTVTRFVARLHGPDATAHDAVVGPGSFDATRRALSRVVEATKGRSEAATEVVWNGRAVNAWAARWPELPAPRIRLADDAVSAPLPDGPLGDALRAGLPPCLGGEAAPSTAASPGYDACRRGPHCEPDACAGWPTGAPATGDTE